MMAILVIYIILYFSPIAEKSAPERYPELPLLYKKVFVPAGLRTTVHGLEYGGDIRIEGGAAQPCFLGAFTQNGEVLWTKGKYYPETWGSGHCIQSMGV